MGGSNQSLTKVASSASCEHNHFFNPCCKENTTAKKVATVFFHILTLGIFIATYHIYKVVSSCFSKKATNSQVSANSPQIDPGSVRNVNRNTTHQLTLNNTNRNSNSYQSSSKKNVDVKNIDFGKIDKYACREIFPAESYGQFSQEIKNRFKSLSDDQLNNIVLRELLNGDALKNLVTDDQLKQIFFQFVDSFETLSSLFFYGKGVWELGDEGKRRLNLLSNYQKNEIKKRTGNLKSFKEFFEESAPSNPNNGSANSSPTPLPQSNGTSSSISNPTPVNRNSNTEESKIGNAGFVNSSQTSLPQSDKPLPSTSTTTSSDRNIKDANFTPSLFSPPTISKEEFGSQLQSSKLSSPSPQPSLTVTTPLVNPTNAPKIPEVKNSAPEIKAAPSLFVNPPQVDNTKIPGQGNGLDFSKFSLDLNNVTRKKLLNLFGCINYGMEFTEHGQALFKQLRVPQVQQIMDKELLTCSELRQVVSDEQVKGLNFDQMKQKDLLELFGYSNLYSSFNNDKGRALFKKLTVPQVQVIMDKELLTGYLLRQVVTDEQVKGLNFDQWKQEDLLGLFGYSAYFNSFNNDKGRALFKKLTVLQVQQIMDKGLVISSLLSQVVTDG